MFCVQGIPIDTILDFILVVTGKIQFENPVRVFIFRNSVSILLNLSTERTYFSRVIKSIWYSSFYRTRTGKVDMILRVNFDFS